MITSRLINTTAIILFCSDCRYQLVFESEKKGALNETKKDFETHHKKCGKEKSDLRKHIEVLNEK